MLASPPTLADFARFAGLMISTQDIDPVYPVLRALNEADGWEPRSARAYQRTFTYVAFYNLPISELVVDAARYGRSRTVAVEMAGKAGIERRGLRRPDRLVLHLDHVAALIRGAGGGASGGEVWLRQDWNGEPKHDWNATRARLEEVHYNGRWASFKTADILAEVHGWPIEAPDAGHQDSTGPLKGLAALLPSKSPLRRDLAELNAITAGLQRELWEAGVPLKMAELETCLCNWHALVEGRYYVGHDIDEMHDQMKALPAGEAETRVFDALLRARANALHPEMLGELGERWSGVRKEKLTAYRDRGEL